VWLEAALVIAPFGVLIGLWNSLPARFPIHWNLHGEVDRWSSNRAEILVLPLITLGVVSLLHLVPRLDPKLRKTLQSNDRMHAVLRIIGIAIAALNSAGFANQLMTAFGYRLATGRIMMAGVLILFLLMGNYLGNLRPNYFVGIRTPWTLENPETWRATHRLGGRLMFFGALILLILQFFLSEPAIVFLITGFAVLLCVWALFYSWHHFRKHPISSEFISRP